MNNLSLIKFGLPIVLLANFCGAPALGSGKPGDTKPLPSSARRWLESLRTAPSSFIVLEQTVSPPWQWYGETDVPYLASLIDSPVRCPRILLSGASTVPVKRISTLGTESARILCGLVEGTYPPLCDEGQLKATAKKWLASYPTKDARRYFVPCSIVDSRVVTVRLTPVQFIHGLKARYINHERNVVWHSQAVLQASLEHWIKRTDLAALSAKLNSKIPSAGINLAIHPDPVDGPSTEGNEATLLLYGFIEKGYPPITTLISAERMQEIRKKVRTWLKVHEAKLEKQTNTSSTHKR